jgi:peptidoglycan/LPS O-acetylase OafA/YrhL
MIDKLKDRFDLVRTAIIAVALVIAFVLGLKAQESGGYVFGVVTYSFIAVAAAILALAYWAHASKKYWQEVIVIVVTLGLAGFISSKVVGLDELGKEEFAQSLRGAGVIFLLIVVSLALTYRKRSSNNPADEPSKKEAQPSKKSKESKKQDGGDAGIGIVTGQHEGTTDNPPVALEPVSL